MKKYDVAVVGATGMVGRKMLEVLEERKFPIGKLYPFASAKSAGSKITFSDNEYEVIELNEKNIKKYTPQIALFSAGAGVSGEFAPIFAREGAIVIDNSSRWRTDPEVPLVVPEVNSEKIFENHGIIANPNC